MRLVYEVSAGSAIAQVEGYCRHLTNRGTFDANSQPTLIWVTAQLNLDASYIAAKLQEGGYAYNQTDEEVLQLLQLWNTLKTVIAVELANPVESISGQGNLRFQEFRNQVKALEALAIGPGLADLGAEVSGGLGEFLTATGVSKDRKAAVEEDTDHIKHRIRRGQFRTPGATDPYADPDWETNIQ